MKFIVLFSLLGLSLANTFNSLDGGIVGPGMLNNLYIYIYNRLYISLWDKIVFLWYLILGKFIIRKKLLFKIRSDFYFLIFKQNMNLFMIKAAIYNKY